MKTLITLFFFLTSLQVVASPEDMYGMYDKDGKHREMTEKMEQIVVQHEQAEEKRQEKMGFILGISVLMGLVPFAYIGYMAIKERQWQTNQKGTVQALGIALLGGAVLFAFNYGLLYLRFIHTNAFYRFGPVVVGLIIIVGTIIMINKRT